MKAHVGIYSDNTPLSLEPYLISTGVSLSCFLLSLPSNLDIESYSLFVGFVFSICINTHLTIISFSLCYVPNLVSFEMVQCLPRHSFSGGHPMT